MTGETALVLAAVGVLGLYVLWRLARWSATYRDGDQPFGGGPYPVGPRGTVAVVVWPDAPPAGPAPTPPPGPPWWSEYHQLAAALGLPPEAPFPQVYARAVEARRLYDAVHPPGGDPKDCA